MAEDDGQYVEDWSELSVAELREECKARGLDGSGKKDELVARLEASDAEAEEGSESDVEPTEDPELDEDPPPAAPAVTEQQGDATYRALVAFPEDVDGLWELEDSDQQAMAMAAREQAVAAGVNPLGGAYCARLLGVENGQAVYEVPLDRTV